MKRLQSLLRLRTEEPIGSFPSEAKGLLQSQYFLALIITPENEHIWDTKSIGWRLTQASLCRGAKPTIDNEQILRIVLVPQTLKRFDAKLLQILAGARRSIIVKMRGVDIPPEPLPSMAPEEGLPAIRILHIQGQTSFMVAEPRLGGGGDVAETGLQLAADQILLGNRAIG